jgi:phage baseplate assembly protein W
MLCRTGPFLGRGVSFPFSVDPVKGGIKMSDATFDGVAVSLEFVPDQDTLGGEISSRENHLTESIKHILLTEKGEYDWLPEFGSKVSTIIHDPNSPYARMEYETWAQLAIARWEKRVRMDGPDAWVWAEQSDESMDRGEAIYQVTPSIVMTQVVGNLVGPFVTPRDARLAEYPSQTIDSEGHDWASRYLGVEGVDVDDARLLRPVPFKPLPPRSDDEFYPVEYGDTYLLIAWKVYTDVRFWWPIADMAVYDAAQAGESWDALDITDELEPGTLLRRPSHARLLTEIAV